MRQQSSSQIDNDTRIPKQKVNSSQFLFIRSRGSSVSSDDFSSLASPDSVNDKTKPKQGKLRQRSKNTKARNMEGTLNSSVGNGSGRGKALLKRRYSVPEIIMRKWVEFIRRNHKLPRLSADLSLPPSAHKFEGEMPKFLFVENQSRSIVFATFGCHQKPLKEKPFRFSFYDSFSFDLHNYTIVCLLFLRTPEPPPPHAKPQILVGPTEVVWGKYYRHSLSRESL